MTALVDAAQSRSTLLTTKALDVLCKTASANTAAVCAAGGAETAVAIVRRAPRAPLASPTNEAELRLSSQAQPTILAAALLNKLAVVNINALLGHVPDGGVTALIGMLDTRAAETQPGAAAEASVACHTLLRLRSYNCSLFPTATAERALDAAMALLRARERTAELPNDDALRGACVLIQKLCIFSGCCNDAAACSAVCRKAAVRAGLAALLRRVWALLYSAADDGADAPQAPLAIALAGLMREFPNAPPPRACDGCGAQGGQLRRCSSCRAVRYCTAACQLANWPIHKAACRAAAAAAGAGGLRG